ncbi:MAG TPA: twin-arginine translocase TatA/TatE family subunit [Candidatus Saccharimonadales bacterium]|nr:twin-arginine translocase TatA/TatE family subunit [Candidatus Saccharimonadales bacterium]
MLSNVAFLDLSTPDLIIILAIVLLIFGGKKLPELSRSLGSSMRELRKGINDGGAQKQKSNDESNNQETA